MIVMSVGGAFALYVAGLVTGWLFPWPFRRRARAASGTETPEQSLARLQGRGTVMPKGSGFVPGPQPRVRPGSSPPAPRGGGGVTPGRWGGGGYPSRGAVRPEDQIPRPTPSRMPSRGTSGGAGQARGR